MNEFPGGIPTKGARRYWTASPTGEPVHEVYDGTKWVNVRVLPGFSINTNVAQFTGPMERVIEAMSGLGLAARKAEESMAGPVSRQRKAAQTTNVPMAGKPRSPRRLHGFKPQSSTNPYGMIFEDPERCATCSKGPQDRSHQVPPATRKPDLGYSVMDRVLVHVQPGARNAADEWALGTVVDVEGTFDDGPGGRAKILLDSQTTPGVPADVSVANWYVCNNAIKRAPVVPRFTTLEEADAWLEAQSEAGRSGGGEAPVDTLIALTEGGGITPSTNSAGWIIGGVPLSGPGGLGPYTAKLNVSNPAPGPTFSARLQDMAGHRSRPFPLAVVGQGVAGPELGGTYVADATDIGRTFAEVVGFADAGIGPVELKTASLSTPCTLSTIGDTVTVTIG